MLLYLLLFTLCPVCFGLFVCLFVFDFVRIDDPVNDDLFVCVCFCRSCEVMQFLYCTVPVVNQFLSTKKLGTASINRLSVNSIINYKAQYVERSHQNTLPKTNDKISFWCWHELRCRFAGPCDFLCMVARFVEIHRGSATKYVPFTANT